MDESLRDRVIAAVEVNQEKCFNVSTDTLVLSLVGRRMVEVTRRGKWLYLHLDSGSYLLINLGMGADLWHYKPGEELPVKYQFRLDLDDGTGFTCRFWWVGYIRLLSAEELPAHPETAKLGPSPLEISPDEFAARARKYPRGTVKSLILDQDKLSGIGNAYAHDILWEARLHPQRKLGSLDPDELATLPPGGRSSRSDTSKASPAPGAVRASRRSRPAPPPPSSARGASRLGVSPPMRHKGEGRHEPCHLFSRVYAIVAQIPPGKVATYGQIAAWLGSPRSARTVGWSMWETPPALNLPCHRVVNRFGAMAPEHVFGGEARQRALLAAEGVTFTENGCVDMAKHMIEGVPDAVMS